MANQARWLAILNGQIWERKISFLCAISSVEILTDIDIFCRVKSKNRFNLAFLIFRVATFVPFFTVCLRKLNSLYVHYYVRFLKSNKSWLRYRDIWITCVWIKFIVNIGTILSYSKALICAIPKSANLAGVLLWITTKNL